MNYININDIAKIVQEKFLFSKLTLNIEDTTKVGIIGPNGGGKSTFLNIVNKEDTLSQGSITYAKSTVIGYLKQHTFTLEAEVTVQDFLNRCFEKYDEVYQRLKKYEKQMEIEYSDKVLNKYLTCLEELNSLDYHELEAEIYKVCDKLEIDKHLLSSKFNLLSTGQKKIIQFAYILLSKPNVLLLDEPTNHLDINKIEILENYVKNFNGAVLIVSHDRDFLNNTTNKTLLIKEGTCSFYSGNYDFYLQENEVENKQLEQQFYAQKKEILKLKRLARQYRQWAQIGDNEKFYKLAKNAEKKLAEMDKIKLKKPKTHKHLSSEVESRLGDEVIIINNLDICYDDQLLIKDLSLDIFRQEKVCLIGPNGCGKSTLIKIIVNAIENDNELFKYADNIKLGYLPQVITFKNENETVYNFTRDFYNKPEHDIRALLYSYDFTSLDLHKKLNSLSGGQRVKLKLMQLIKLKSNLLIWDEPTNNLDIETCELLEKALQEYNGTMLFISHDRYFIDKISTTSYKINNKHLSLLD